MSLRSKYLGILSDMVPAGALGVLLLLGSAVPCDAGEHPSNSLPSATPGSPNGSPPFARRSPNSAGRASGRAKANSSWPGEIGGVTADGVTAGGAIGATAGIMVGPIGGITGEPAFEPNTVKPITFQRGKAGQI